MERPPYDSRQFWTIALVVLLFLYPLSTGPVTVIFVRIKGPPDSMIPTPGCEVYDQFYAPLGALPTPVVHALDYYIAWCLRVTGTAT